MDMCLKERQATGWVAVLMSTIRVTVQYGSSHWPGVHTFGHTRIMGEKLKA